MGYNGNLINIARKELLAKLRTWDKLTSTNNVKFGETKDMTALLSSDQAKIDENFPRLEVLIIKDKQNGAFDQYSINHSFRFSILLVYAKPDGDDNKFTDADYDIIFEYYNEVINLINSFNDDKIAGTNNIPGFQYVEDYGESFFEEELFANMYSIEIFQAFNIDMNEVTQV